MKKALPFLCVMTIVALAGCDRFSTPNLETQIASAKLADQGYALLDQQQYSVAGGVFDQAIATDSKNVRALQGKGIALNKLGKHDEAEAMYKKALAVSPGSVGVTNNLAMSKILRGQPQEAIDLLTPLSSSNNQTVQENLALANCLLGKRDVARSIYSKYMPSKQVEDNMRMCGDFNKKSGK